MDNTPTIDSDAFFAKAPIANDPNAAVDSDAYFSKQPSAVSMNGKPQDLLSKVYHAGIEGGAMGVGALAATPLDPETAGMASVGAATAMYPMAKHFADAIDSIRGVASEQTTPLQDIQSGLINEAGGRAIAPVLGAVGDMLPSAKAGEAISGTPASNLKRAFKNGFAKTFFSPMPMAEASEQYGDEFTRLMGDHFTPQQQADLLLNPTGMAKDALDTAIQKSITGQPLTTQEAIAAKRGIDVVMPAGTAKNLPRIKGFSDFDSYLNDTIAKQDPAFKAANDNYAASKLRSQLLMFGMVNKSNPNEYSKLGQMIFDGMGIATGIGTGSFKNAALAAGSQVAASPFVMGLVSAASGSGSRVAMKALENPLIQRAASSAVNDYFSQNDGNVSQNPQ